MRDDQVAEILNQKLKIAKNAIIDQQEKGVFPIIGYSYYEYASSLADKDVAS